MDLQAAIDLCHAYHGGQITIKTPDLQSHNIMAELVKNTKKAAYHWRVKPSRSIRQRTFIYSGRRFDDIALSEKGGQRQWLLEEMDIDINNHFDLKAAVPSLHKLLTNGIWSATDPNIHLRKDIAKRLGINETPDDKTITFRWLFEPDMEDALNHWHWFKRQKRNKDCNFTYTDETFIKGWVMMQQSVYPNRDGLPWTLNAGYALSHSIFYWESMLEEMVYDKVIDMGYRIANAYDCFYTTLDIPALIKVIDGEAAKLYKIYWAEIDKLKTANLSLAAYGSGCYTIPYVAIFDPTSGHYKAPAKDSDITISSHKRHKEHSDKGVARNKGKQELAIFCKVSKRQIERELASGMTYDEIKNKKRRKKRRVINDKRLNLLCR
jgi:hypothetical protein